MTFNNRDNIRVRLPRVVIVVKGEPVCLLLLCGVSVVSSVVAGVDVSVVSSIVAGVNVSGVSSVVAGIDVITVVDTLSV